MNYKYRKGQIFGKRLKVPKYILNRVYNNSLSLFDFLQYELDDKIPTSCLNETDRQLVEKFGIEKIRGLDRDLLNINNRAHYNPVNIDIMELLRNIPVSTDDINMALYEEVKDKIPPSQYSTRMKELYADRLFELSPNREEDSNYEEKVRFNDGRISLEEILRKWDFYKDKDLSFCLSSDYQNQMGITDRELKQFMTQYQGVLPILEKDKTVNIYTFIHSVSSMLSEEERKSYISQFTDSILSNSYITIFEDEYREIFKYSSLEDYLMKFSEYGATAIMEELQTLPPDYLFNIPIPFPVLCNSNVLSFIRTYGLKNIVDFDNECGQFFTKNNCEMLKLMDDMYLHYAGNEPNPNKNIHTKNSYDENGNYVDRPYTKDEFYEAMKRMIIYGPSDWNYASKAPDYRTMTGEFRIRNEGLFLSEEAPEELQKLFYTKSLTPRIIVEHPEYIKYLKGKDLSSCFQLREVQISGANSSYEYENFYQLLGTKLDFNSVMSFIMDYSDILDIVFDRSKPDYYQYEMNLLMTDDINQIKQRINESFKTRITKKDYVYPKRIPSSLKDAYPSLFLSDEAPKELQDAFYNRTITSTFILSNPSYKEYLRTVDMEVLFPHIEVRVLNSSNRYEYFSLVEIMSKHFEFDTILLYEKYMSQVFPNNSWFYIDEMISSSEDLSNRLDKEILTNIIDGKIKYDEMIPEHFKNNNPTLFLNRQVPQDIRNKFYNREFTLQDFMTNPELLKLFGDTNVVCGFSEELSWMIPLFNNLTNSEVANSNRIKVISAYSQIQDVALKNAFKEYVMEFGDNIDITKIGYISNVLSRLSLSNSSEIFTFRKELATQILKSDNPLESLSKIEDVFIRNNIPTVGKIFSCFEILHPDFQGFQFDNISTISPVLKNSSTSGKKIVVFSDLIKASFGSNNRSINAYLKNIEIGSNLYDSIRLGQVPYDTLSEEELNELIIFSKHLATLYNNTRKAKNETFLPTGDILNDILELSKRLSPNGTLDYNIGDRVIRMFCGFAGIDTLEQAKEYIHQKVNSVDARNREAANTEMEIHQGDFIKGIGNVTYLRNILQNGSVSKEFLGSSAGSDNTPLDTDVSMITRSDGTLKEKMEITAASQYGPIWFVLKNDERFITTRTITGTLDVKRDRDKMEAFYTGVLGEGHYGIRTGFASSEINYIVMENYDPRVGLELAMNGFYIPVANMEGKIIFTPSDYDKLRAQMSGLSYYGEENYTFSDNLVTEETTYFAEQIEQSNYEVQGKRTRINDIIRSSLEELGLKLKTTIDGDLTEGFVELIDTGSTGRGTNKPGDGDFDFMMRLDKTLLSNPQKLEELKRTILRNLGKENSSEITGTGDFRLKSVPLDSEISVDIDITFTEKTDKVSYSTDMSLQDRLATIQRNDSEKYKYVVANILLAKRVLKEAGAYKPNRGEVPQGGLGGVGIENWILQNGGSFIDAARSFLETAEGKSFEEFQASYQIWDFGDNHLAERRGQYVHDNFVASNMSESGYQKMVQALKEYLKTVQLEQTESIHK